MTQQLEILILDMAGSGLLKQVKTFFDDEPVVLKVVDDLALFETLANKDKRAAMDMAIILVEGSNSHLIKSKYPIPTFVFQPHTYTYKKMMQFYKENGGGDG